MANGRHCHMFTGGVSEVEVEIQIFSTVKHHINKPDLHSQPNSFLITIEISIETISTDNSKMPFLKLLK